MRIRIDARQRLAIEELLEAAEATFPCHFRI
jgi:hypothetical protein